MFLTVKNHYNISIVGFAVILSIVMQLIFGISLAFSLISKIMLVPSVKNKKNTDALFTDGFFFTHKKKQKKLAGVRRNFTKNSRKN